MQPILMCLAICLTLVTLAAFYLLFRALGLTETYTRTLRSLAAENAAVKLASQGDGLAARSVLGHSMATSRPPSPRPNSSPRSQVETELQAAAKKREDRPGLKIKQGLR